MQKQYNIIKEYGSKIGFVFCGAEFFNQQGIKIKTKKYNSDEKIKSYYEQCISLEFKMYTPTLIVKKDILTKINYFDEDLPSNQETELMVRVTKICDGYCVNNVLAKINFLDGEHIGGNVSRRIKGKELVLQKHWEEFNKRPVALSKCYYTLGDLYRSNNDFKKAQKYYKKSWQKDKKQIKALLLFILLFNHLFYRTIIAVKNAIKNS